MEEPPTYFHMDGVQSFEFHSVSSVKVSRTIRLSDWRIHTGQGGGGAGEQKEAKGEPIPEPLVMTLFLQL